MLCSPAFSPDFAEPPSPWPGGGGGGETDGETLSYNQRNIKKWEKDEPLGNQATISPVLYANINYPDLKKDFPGLFAQHVIDRTTRQCSETLSYKQQTLNIGLIIVFTAGINLCKSYYAAKTIQLTYCTYNLLYLTHSSIDLMI